jgi:hypothetical protein
MRTSALCGGRLDQQRHHIEVEQDREVGRHRVDQLLEALGIQQEQDRGMHPVLGVVIGAAGTDEGALLLLQPLDLAAQPFGLEALQVDHPVAAIPRRQGQPGQQIRVLDQEVRMGQQPSRDVRRGQGGGVRPLHFLCQRALTPSS